MKHRRDKEE